MLVADPILTCAEAKEFEAALFAGDEAREWTAMQRAGRAVADAVLRDFQELGPFPVDARVLVLAGKGHNAGDAFIAASRLRELHPRARIDVHFAFGERTLRPLARRAWRELAEAPVAPSVSSGTAWVGAAAYDLILDGLFGFQFRPPLDSGIVNLLRALNATPARLRAAIDLPSGLDDPNAFRANFTYATGSVKSPALTLPTAGRVRYLDLGFFKNPPRPICHLLSDKPDRVFGSEVLAEVRALRPVHSDKRTYGHVCVVGGSRSYPGAVLMSVLAALRSGAGLVTAFVPESLAAAFAARAPEAMWVGWPETPEGGLALEGHHLLREKGARATAVLLGPGLARERETLALARDIVAQASLPLVIDADALQPDIVAAGNAPRILTPHAGEWARISEAVPANAVTVRKGPLTHVAAAGVRYHCPFGGPVLARGGSGDLLAGLIAGQLAQKPADPLGAAARGVVWHGLAADALARSQGQVAVNTTQLLDYLAPALRE